MDEQVERKDNLRQHYKNLRRSMPEEQRWEIDSEITRRLCKLEAYKNADAVLSYLSIGSEVETRGIIQQAWQDDKIVALPRCVPGTRDLEWRIVTSLEGMEESENGILEPPRAECALLDPQTTEHMLAVVPGLAFDTLGYRLGYGGGYFDVFLANYLSVSVGLCREANISKEYLRLDSFDMPVDIVVTEKRSCGLASLSLEED